MSDKKQLTLLDVAQALDASIVEFQADLRPCTHCNGKGTPCRCALCRVSGRCIVCKGTGKVSKHAPPFDPLKSYSALPRTMLKCVYCGLILPTRLAYSRHLQNECRKRPEVDHQ